MPRSFTNLLTHFIWATKLRNPWLSDEIRPRVHAYLGGIVRNLKGVPIEINGTTDHIHALVRVHASTSVAEVAGKVKANSSRWIHETFPAQGDFAWQSGYAAFPVAQSGLDKVRVYIQRQVEHHKKAPFLDEIHGFLRLNGLNPDEWSDE